MRLPAIAAAGLFLAASSTTAEEVSSYDRFQLWNDCRPMDLVVEEMTDDAADIGLTENAITVAVRSRLRAGRLYSDDYDESAWSYLLVSVTVISNAFGIDVRYHKIVTDAATEFIYSSPTWEGGGVGTHGQSPDYIVSSVSQNIDQFIDEYLRVNADACRNSN